MSIQLRSIKKSEFNRLCSSLLLQENESLNSMADKIRVYISDLPSDDKPIVIPLVCTTATDSKEQYQWLCHFIRHSFSGLERPVIIAFPRGTNVTPSIEFDFPERDFYLCEMAVPYLEEAEDSCFRDIDYTPQSKKLSKMQAMAEPIDNYSSSAFRTLADVPLQIGASFLDIVFQRADSLGLTDVELYKRANLDKKAFSKLRCQKTKHPSKSTALAIGVALHLNIDEMKDLLSRAGYALSPCDKRDLIIQYFIEHEFFEVDTINYALFEHRLPLLGSTVEKVA